jgi:hypothetical protein
MLDKIAKFLRRNALTIMLAVVPPLLIWFFLQKESTDLSVTVTSKTSVVSLNSDFSDGVEVYHNKKPINGLFVADIKIKNEGNRPIEKADFDTPLKVEFNGEVIKPVKLVSTEPAGLPVDASVDKQSVVINPLLINPEDTFHIQVKVVNPENNELDISPSARIRAIKELTFNPYSDTDDPWYSFVLGIIASLLAITSLVSSKNLFQQFKLISISLPGVTVELTKELEANQQISQRMEALAEKLSISGHDFKSNILLLRLKIESLLRELVTLNNIKVRNIGSVSFLMRELDKANLIDKKVISLIRDISPAMNRELHESESYLSEDEFEVLQHAALTVIASLEESLEETSA